MTANPICGRHWLTLVLLVAGSAAPAHAADAEESADINGGLTREAFPLPRHDPRPLMQELIEREQPTEATRFTFVAVSDMHSRREAATFELLHELDPDFALTMGDMINAGHGAQGLAHYQRLEEHGGDFFRQYPTWAAPGNHEVGRGGREEKTRAQQAEARARFSAYFAQPHDEIFSFTYANTKFIGLPYEFFETDALLDDLEQELASGADGSEHIVVFSHHAISTGLWRPANPVRDAAVELFTKYDVTIVLGGGTHVYYRQHRDGVHYILNATAGMSGRVHADRDHATLRDSLPDDVWFARDEEGGQIIRPEGEEPVPVEGSVHFATVITVEGPTVTFRLVSTDGQEWDSATLVNAVPEADPADEGRE